MKADLTMDESLGNRASEKSKHILCHCVCCRFACCAQYILDINSVSVHNLFQHFPPPEDQQPFVYLSFDASINASQSVVLYCETMREVMACKLKNLQLALVASSSGSGCCECVVGSRFPISFISTFRDSVRVNIRCIMISEDPI